MKCFYHSADLDGHCAGASVKYFQPECELIGINYGDKFPWDDIKSNEVVYMVDFSLQPFEEMMKLNTRCNLIWLDHHESAIKEYEKHHMCDILGIQRNGMGACALVWEYFKVEPPRCVKLLAEYDVWNHTDPETLPLQYGMRMLKDIPWERLFIYDELEMVDIIDIGRTIIKYEKQQNERYIKSCCYEKEFFKFKAIVCNKMLTNSQLFDSIYTEEKYDLMITYGFRKKYWTVSLYSTWVSIDCGAIAKEFGGGGHKGAAGFQCDFEFIRRYLL